MASFLWERERITNEDVMNCAAEYMAHMAADIKTSSSSMTSPTQPAPPTSSPLPPAISPATSPASTHAATSSLSSWSWMGWLPSYSSSGAPASLQADGVRKETPFSEGHAQQGFGSWLMSWLTWSTPTDAALRTKNETTLENVREHKACLLDQVDKESREEQARREECRRIAQVLQAQLDKDASRRPLVGLTHINSWRDLNVGPRLIEYALERAKVRISELTKDLLLRSRSALRTNVAEKNNSELSMPGSSVLDLACIGGGEDFFAVPSDNNDSYKFYMQVELEESAGSAKSHEKLDKPFRVQWEVISSQLDQHLGDFQESIEAGLGFFQEELLFEGLQGSQSVATDETVKETITSAVDKGIKLCSDTVSSFPSKVRLKKEDKSGISRKKPLDFDLTLKDVKLDVGAWTSSGWSFPDVKLVVLKEEFARKLFTSSAVISLAGGTQESLSDHLAGWECINKDRNYVAYRKLYKDTGLYQFKVIGQFDDIAAKDFLDVQMDHEKRRNWDNYAGDLVVLDRDKLTNSRLLHWIMKYPFPMSNREYVFVQRIWTSEPNDVIVIMSRATSHPDVKSSYRHVRVSDYFSDMVVCATSTIDQPGMKFELSYFDNPRSNLPSSCVNWVTYSALPDFITKVHSAAAAQRQLH